MGNKNNSPNTHHDFIYISYQHSCIIHTDTSVASEYSLTSAYSSQHVLKDAVPIKALSARTVCGT